MLTIIHGDDTEKSYQELNRIKESIHDSDVRILDGKHLTTTELTEALQSSSLFGKDVSIVIERLLTTVNKKTILYGQLVEIINQSLQTADIFLYETKELDKTTLGKFGTDIAVRSFMIPRVIFEFIDGLHTGNIQSSILTFRAIVAHEPVEIVFSMMVKRFRYLIELSDGITPDGVAPWQAARLTRQARFFTMEKLVSMYKKLASIEVAVKTGGSPFTLTQQIEQYIVAL